MGFFNVIIVNIVIIADWLVDATDEKQSFQDAYCKICKKYLRAHKTDLEKHTLSVKHKKKMKFVYPDKQTTLNRNIILNNEQKEKRTAICFKCDHAFCY